MRRRHSVRRPPAVPAPSCRSPRPGQRLQLKSPERSPSPIAGRICWLRCRNSKATPRQISPEQHQRNRKVESRKEDRIDHRKGGEQPGTDQDQPGLAPTRQAVPWVERSSGVSSILSSSCITCAKAAVATRPPMLTKAMSARTPINPLAACSCGTTNVPTVAPIFAHAAAKPLADARIAVGKRTGAK